MGTVLPAPRGNLRALTHGGRSMIRLAPRAAEIADDLRQVVPTVSEADEPTIRLLALVLARVEVVNVWLDEHGLLKPNGAPQAVLGVLSTWENTASRLCDRLGLTPTSRAQLGLHVTRARGEALRSHLAEHYDGDG